MALRLDDTCKGRVLGRSDDGRFTNESTRRKIEVLEEGATTTEQRWKNGLNRQSRFVIERFDERATDAATGWPTTATSGFPDTPAQH